MAIVLMACGVLAPARAQIIGAFWEASRTDPCGLASGVERAVLAYDPNDPMFPDVIVADWGDIEADTVFDQFIVRIVTFLSDADGTPGIVEGCVVTVRIFDRDDGLGDGRRVLLTQITSGDLPADTGGGGTIFSLELDLPSQVEIGDTDMIGAPTLNPMSFADFDGDGLHDFGYEIEFAVPPGVAGDGIGVVLVGPDLTGGTIPSPTSPPGMTDLIDLRLPGGSLLRTINFGGPQCGTGPTAAQGTVPFAQAYFVVRIEPCNPADVAAPFGLLSFGDISTFLGWFASGNLIVDFAAPFGLLTFADISVFLDAYFVGCP